MADITPLKLTPEGNVSRAQVGDVIPLANGGTGATTASGAATNILPSQLGNDGKVLSTNGTTVSWAAPTVGYTGSAGANGGIGYTGSASTVVGYTGSAGTTGGIGYTGSAGGAQWSVSGNDIYYNTGNVSVGNNFTLTGLGKRITGDFSNATASNRVMFQTNVANGITAVSYIPNGTGTGSYHTLYNTADPHNASIAQMACDATDVFISAGKVGTGTYIPMKFYTGGSKRIEVSTNGAVSIGSGVTPSATDPTYYNSLEVGKAGNGITGANPSLTGSELIYFTGNCYVTYAAGPVWKYANDGYAGRYAIEDGIHFWHTAPTSTTGSTLTWGSPALTIDRSNNVLATGSGGLGYGTGSGGTVTQATSKSTAVTLNKPNGVIVMASGSMPANGVVQFQVNNSLVVSTDHIIITPAGPNGAVGYNYHFGVLAGNNGLFYVSVRNMSAGALDEAISIKFAIIKGATA